MAAVDNFHRLLSAALAERLGDGDQEEETEVPKPWREVRSEECKQPGGSGTLIGSETRGGF